MKTVYAKITATPKYLQACDIVYCKWDEVPDQLELIGSDLQFNIKDTDTVGSSVTVEYMVMTPEAFEDFCKTNDVEEF
jgi:hypothetical protein